MPIINDIHGQDLLLSKNRLEEIEGSLRAGERWGVTFASIRKAAKDGQRVWATLPAKYSRDTKRATYLSFNPTKKLGFGGSPPLSIGCREFDEKTFARILRVAGVPTQKRTKKAA